jgi:bifunctional non-homologous end joining protein LigD
VDSLNTRVKLTNLNKVFWPEAGYTKGDLVEYYQKASQYILPYLKDRPHSLLRQPDGYKGESFFQKDVDHTPPSWIKTKAIHSESTDEMVNYLVCDSTDSLIYMVQLGCIEVNPWSSRLASLSKPDWLVLDLDPEAIGFDKVIETAQAVRTVLDELRIKAYLKTSGKTGIHIFVPLNARHTYDKTQQYAEIVANLVHERTNAFTSLERIPAKRQKKVYIDYLQNGKGKTLAAPYSVRPTKAATISTPLEWNELRKGLDPQKFTMKNIFKRLDAVGDLWRPVLGKAASLEQLDELIK